MLNAIILSAGYGKRMNSDLPKGMYPLLGKPFISYILDTFDNLKIDNLVVVLGHKMECFNDAIKGHNVKVSIQEVLNGTAKAVEAARDNLENAQGETIVTPVDSPIISAELYTELLEFHRANNNALTLLTTSLENPYSYGRILRDKNGDFSEIKEEADASEEERLIKEVNAGIYIFNNKLLFKYIKEIKPNNKKQEYYLTDIAKILIENGYKVGAYKTDKYKETLSINDLDMLKKVENVLKERI